MTYAISHTSGRKDSIHLFKKVKDGFWCVACALDKHVITDKHVIRFLKNKQTPTHLGFRIPKKEPYRY